MPELNPGAIALIGSLAAGVTQLLKGVLFTEEGKRWLPLLVLVFCTGAGAGLAAAYSRDVVAGVIEGIMAGLSSLGLYATTKSVAPSLVNTKGWLRRNKDS